MQAISTILQLGVSWPCRVRLRTMLQTIISICIHGAHARLTISSIFNKHIAILGTSGLHLAHLAEGHRLYQAAPFLALKAMTVTSSCPFLARAHISTGTQITILDQTAQIFSFEAILGGGSFFKVLALAFWTLEPILHLLSNNTCSVTNNRTPHVVARLLLSRTRFLSPLIKTALIPTIMRTGSSLNLKPLNSHRLPSTLSLN